MKDWVLERSTGKRNALVFLKPHDVRQAIDGDPDADLLVPWCNERVDAVQHDLARFLIWLDKPLREAREGDVSLYLERLQEVGSTFVPSRVGGELKPIFKMMAERERMPLVQVKVPTRPPFEKSAPRPAPARAEPGEPTAEQAMRDCMELHAALTQATRRMLALRRERILDEAELPTADLLEVLLRTSQTAQHGEAEILALVGAKMEALAAELLFSLGLRPGAVARAILKIAIARYGQYADSEAAAV